MEALDSCGTPEQSRLDRPKRDYNIGIGCRLLVHYGTNQPARTTPPEKTRQFTGNGWGNRVTNQQHTASAHLDFKPGSNFTAYGNNTEAAIANSHLSFTQEFWVIAEGENDSLAFTR